MNTAKFLEASYEEFAKQSSRDWVFRVDADEIPNAGAIEFLNNLAAIPKESVIGFQRSQIILLAGKFFILGSEEFEPETHRQWRFFNKTTAKWLKRIHTPGIEITSEQYIPAPQDAKLYHLEFLYLDQESLRKKSARYDESGQGTEYHKYQRNISTTSLKQLDDPLLLDFLEKNRHHFFEWVSH